MGLGGNASLRRGSRSLGFSFLCLSFQILTDEERRRRVEKAETAVLVGAKDMESRCYQELVGMEIS